MHVHTKIRVKILVACALVCLLAACAKPYHLGVDYRLPEETDQLEGQRVHLMVEDQREDKTVFSDTALKEFALWDGTYALAPDGTPPMEPVETYGLTELFHEAMQKRLEAMQITVVDTPGEGTPTLAMTLEKVVVDLRGKTWHMQIVYKVRLSRDSRKIARESVNGQAERVKIMGKGGGEKLIGELFTDVINKLNIPKLFDNAGLLE